MTLIFILGFYFKGFLSARQLNPNTSIKIIKEELEPSEFKQYFGVWEATTGRTYQAGRGIATRGMWCMVQPFYLSLLALFSIGVFPLSLFLVGGAVA